jgi:nucleoside phosphorylase
LASVKIFFLFMVAVTFALPAESSEFARHLRNRSRGEHQGVRIVRGEMGGRGVEVLHTGVGGKICRERIEKFLAATEPARGGERDRRFEYLISAGFAGALSDQLRVGDLLLAQNFSTVGGAEILQLAPRLPIRCGNLLTLPAMIEAKEERTKIAQTTGAMAADMETEFIARACARHGIPLLSLRVITDTPRDPFPGPAEVLFDIAKQRPPLAKLGTFFLAHPNCIPRLVQFAQRIARARKILANALLELVKSLP